MAHEIDIIAVGDESQNGDAIALRFGNFVQNLGEQKVVVIDGGFKDSGEKLVKRIRDEYGAEHVDLVISTHPDNDHIAGLHVVLEELSVDELWMHRPWYMSSAVKKLAEENRELTTLGRSNKLKKSLESAYDLEKLAERKGIKIFDPFQGTSAFDNKLYVLGPSKEFYQQLVAQFEKSPAYSLLEKAKRIISEVWHRDELAEPEADAVSPRNNSSVVLLVQLDDDHFLFTGDAGLEALNHAADYASASGYDLATKIKYQQVSHHGSKRNLGPSVLDLIVGPIQPENQQKINKTAFISAAAKGHPKHPSKRVTNAFIRRGVTVTATCGQDHCFRSLDVPIRAGWGPITPLDFAHIFEEEE